MAAPSRLAGWCATAASPLQWPLSRGWRIVRKRTVQLSAMEDSFVACGTVRGRGRFDSARPVTTASMNGAPNLRCQKGNANGQEGLIFRASGFRLGCEAERKVLNSYVLRRVNPRASANQVAR